MSEENKIETKDEPANEWLDILDNGQILKKVIKEGNKEKARPEKGCRVKLNVTTKLKESGVKIDSDSFYPIDIFVGDCDINHALDLVVPLMNVEEISNVIVAPRFAYGEKGRDNDIPPNSHLDITVELLSIDWVEELNEIDVLERIKIGESKKEKGNFFFTRGEYSNSVMLYKRAVEFLDIDPSDLGDEVEEGTLEKIMELKASSYNNLAQAQMKMDALDAALTAVNCSLAINENNVKALFRKGKILASKGDLQEALEVFKAAANLDPENRLIKIELVQTSKAYSKQLEEEKLMFKKMLRLDDNKISKVEANKKWYKPKALIIFTSIGVAAIGAALYQSYAF